jgi:DNA-directed RNA polymerase subunit H (RpoH/RPB5)
VISARIDEQIALLPELKLVEHELARALARAPVVEVADRETAVGEVAEKIRRSLTIGTPGAGDFSSSATPAGLVKCSAAPERRRSRTKGASPEHGFDSAAKPLCKFCLALPVNAIVLPDIKM